MDKTIFYIKKEKKKIDASGFYMPEIDHFVVLEGSKIPYYPGSSLKNKSERAELIKQYCEDYDDDTSILIKDVEFDSCSAAAVFVNSMSSNGWTEWKTENGITIKEIYKK